MAKWPDRKQRMLEPKARLEGYFVAYFDEWTFRKDKMFIGQNVKMRLASLAAALERRLAERDALQQVREPLFEHLLARVRLRALSLVPGAVVVDVLTLLDLAHERATAVAARDQAG